MKLVLMQNHEPGHVVIAHECYVKNKMLMQNSFTYEMTLECLREDKIGWIIETEIGCMFMNDKFVNDRFIEIGEFE